MANAGPRLAGPRKPGDRIGLVDFGMFGRLEPGERRGAQPTGQGGPFRVPSPGPGGAYGAPPDGLYGAPPSHYPLSGLAAALTALLALNAAAALGSIAVTGLGVLEVLLFVATIPVFIVWFYRARKNADGRGWHQRRSPGWAIGGWFVPVVTLWFPYMIMTDIWRAALPAQQRGRPPWLPISWWACWLLSWFTGFHYVHGQSGTSSGFQVSFLFASTVISKIFGAAAAIMALIVYAPYRAAASAGRRSRTRPGRTEPRPFA